MTGQQWHALSMLQTHVPKTQKIHKPLVIYRTKCYTEIVSEGYRPQMRLVTYVGFIHIFKEERICVRKTGSHCCWFAP